MDEDYDRFVQEAMNKPKEEKTVPPINLDEPVEEKVEDIKIEQEKETEPDDDNLFDLIDSMYEE